MFVSQKPGWQHFFKIGVFQKMKYSHFAISVTYRLSEAGLAAFFQNWSISKNEILAFCQSVSLSSCCIISLHVCNAKTLLRKKLGVEGRHVYVVSGRHRAGKLGMGRGLSVLEC